jgi:hypothetical protein
MGEVEAADVIRVTSQNKLDLGGGRDGLEC